MFKQFMALVSANFLLIACDKKEQYRIDVVLPMAHKSLQAIANGFQESLPSDIDGKKTVVKIHNAQGDINTQRVIIQHQKANLLVTVATGCTKMALTLRPDQKILGLASLPLTSPHKNFTILTDEISPEHRIALLKAMSITSLALIHSLDDKDYRVAKEFVAKKQNLVVERKTIQQLTDLRTVVGTIRSPFLFFLKDNLIASGVKTLTQQGKPVIASDEMSVKEGGAVFALDVEEAEIGRKGAALAVQMLQGQAVASQAMDQFTLFVNPATCAQYGIDVEALKAHAEQQGYAFHVF